MIAIGLQYRMLFQAFRYMACFSCLGCACYGGSFALAKDMKLNLKSISDLVKRKSSESDIFKELSRFIRLHSITKQFSYEIDFEKMPRKVHSEFN